MSDSPRSEAVRPLARRDAMKAVGLGAVVTATVAGCMKDEPETVKKPSSSTGDPVPGASTSSTDSSAGAISIEKAKVPVGGAYLLQDQKIIVTQPVEGQFKAFSAICTHKGCPVSEQIKDKQIVCPCHNSFFDMATGAVKSGPAKAGLTEKTIAVSDKGLDIG